MQSTSIIIFYSIYQKQYKNKSVQQNCIKPFSIQLVSHVITLSAYWDVMTCIWVDKLPTFKQNTLQIFLQHFPPYHTMWQRPQSDTIIFTVKGIITSKSRKTSMLDKNMMPLQFYIQFLTALIIYMISSRVQFLSCCGNIHDILRKTYVHSMKTNLKRK